MQCCLDRQKEWVGKQEKRALKEDVVSACYYEGIVIIFFEHDGKWNLDDEQRLGVLLPFSGGLPKFVNWHPLSTSHNYQIY